MTKLHITVRQSFLGFHFRNSQNDKRSILLRPYINHLVHARNSESQWNDICNALLKHTNN